MEECIIVMGNGMVRVEGVDEEQLIQRALFTELLVADLIPFIEAKYPVKNDK